MFEESGDSTFGCCGGVELVLEAADTAEGDRFGDLDF